MVTSSLQLLHALYAIAAKYGKSYCFPSQEKILELLKVHYDISITDARTTQITPIDPQ
jgi:hypothetical protein